MDLCFLSHCTGISFAPYHSGALVQRNVGCIIPPPRCPARVRMALAEPDAKSEDSALTASSTELSTKLDTEPGAALMSSPEAVVAVSAAGAVLVQRFAALLAPRSVVERISARANQILYERRMRTRLRDARAQLLLAEDTAVAEDATLARVEGHLAEALALAESLEARVAELETQKGMAERAIKNAFAQEKMLHAIKHDLKIMQTAGTHETRSLEIASDALYEKREVLSHREKDLQLLHSTVEIAESNAATNKQKLRVQTDELTARYDACQLELQDVLESNQKLKYSIENEDQKKLAAIKARVESVTAELQDAERELVECSKMNRTGQSTEDAKAERELVRVRQQIQGLGDHLKDMHNAGMEVERLSAGLERREAQLVEVREKLADVKKRGAGQRPLEFDLSRHLSAPLPSSSALEEDDAPVSEETDEPQVVANPESSTATPELTAKESHFVTLSEEHVSGDNGDRIRSAVESMVESGESRTSPGIVATDPHLEKNADRQDPPDSKQVAIDEVLESALLESKDRDGKTVAQVAADRASAALKGVGKSSNAQSKGKRVRKAGKSATISRPERTAAQTQSSQKKPADLTENDNIMPSSPIDFSYTDLDADIVDFPGDTRKRGRPASRKKKSQE